MRRMGRNRVVGFWPKMMAANRLADPLFSVIVIVLSIEVRFAVLNIKHRFLFTTKVTISAHG